MSPRSENPERRAPRRTRSNSPQAPSERQASTHPSRSSRPKPQIASQQKSLRRTKAAQSETPPIGDLLGSFVEFAAEFDSAGVILKVWKADNSLLHHPVHQMLGKRLRDVIGAEAYSPFQKVFPRVHRTDVAEEFVYRLDLADGQHWFLARAIPIGSRGASSRTIRLLAQDITERQEAQRARHESDERYRLLVDGLKDYAIFTIDCDGFVISWNLGAECITGFKSDEIIGQHFSCFYPPDDIASEKPIRELQRAFNDGRLEDEGWRLRKDGSRFWADVTMTSLRDRQGQLKGFANITRDMTERRRTEQELRKRQALLAQAEILANMGSWEIDAAANTVTWSDHLFRMLNLEPPASPASLDDLWKLIHLEEPTASQQAVATAVLHSQSLNRTDRYISRSGQVRTLHSRGMPVTDALGRTIRLIGTTQDITERKSIEEKLRKSEALLTQAETLANVGSWEFDVDTSEIVCSAQLYRILGLDPNQTYPAFDSFSQLLSPDDRETMLLGDAPTKTKPQPFEREIRWVLPDGSAKLLHIRSVPIYDKSGELLRLIGTTEDVTERRHREDELRRLSQQLLNVRDEEQRRVARDLHETAVQSMAAMKMLLDRVDDLIPKANNRARKLIQSTAEIADEIISQVRTISHLLHPPLLDEAGLSPAVRWYARGFAERSGIATRVELDEDFGRLPHETELAVFRIVQEALTNVHRHSGSPDAIIRVKRDEGNVCVEVEDHGRGMALSSKTGGSEVRLGVGTAGMRERVTQLSGIFEIRSAPGNGTTVCVNLPLTQPERNIGSHTREA
ncbi:MAG: PAS domain S-box protein [Candidatus Acidiferrales bacterium]